METLAQELFELQMVSAARTSDDRKAGLGRRLAVLDEAGIADGAITVGDDAPGFTLPDAVGYSVALDALLSTGPAVVSFYRGAWCPYCNLELRALQRALSGISDTGATLVAISPNVPDASMTVVERHALEYPVLSDAGNAVARSYGLVFTVPSDLEAEYRDMGLDVGAMNGSDMWEIPIPATYVIDRDGTVVYSFVDVDYRKRAEPADVVAALKAL